jgi:gliding motility-associated-like protein
MKLFLSLCCIFLSCLSALAQPGKDGALTVSSPNTVVNCYTAVTANVAAGSSTVTTTGTCAFTCGDLVMIYQAQGATMNTTNTSSYGTITAYNNSGLYEFNYVTQAAGGVLTVQNPWVNSYTATGRVQIVKVPQYTNLTVTAAGSIIPSAWQDVGANRIGGIVAIHATGTVTVNGSIKATGFGFRPGPLDNSSGSAGAGLVSLYVSATAADGGAKGESIAGFFDVYDVSGGRYGRGAPANGGGGGNSHNCGGGAGANGNNGNVYNGQGVMCSVCVGPGAWALDPFTIANGGVNANSSGGGRGGYSYGSSNQNALVLAPSAAAWGGDQRDPFGGEGGHPLNITATSRIFFGGGGGAGDANNSANQVGGTGGGIVYIMANTITGAGQINSNGTDALNQVALGTAGANDAPSGAAGGGTVILRSATITGVSLNAFGGKGGDQGFLATESEGPGGGGGGGYIAISAGTPTTNITGGDNGITLSGSLTEFTPNGATKGATGQTAAIGLSTLAYAIIPPIVTNATTPVCVGSPINFTTTGIAGFTYAWSGPPAFSSTLQNPTIASAALTNTGTFQVIYTSPGGCKDTNTVAVVVNPLPIITPTVTNPLCNGSCTGSVNAVPSAGTPSYTFAWNTGATTQIINSLCVGSYTVTVTDVNGCIATSTSTITQPTAISGTTVNVNPLCNGGSTGSITVNASGGTGALQYSLNGGAFQPSNIFNTLPAGPYTITVKDANGCTFTIITSLTNPPVLTITLVSTTPATCGVNNGTLTVSGAGGTGALTYSTGGPFVASPTFGGLAAGAYTVTVKDANGCTATVPATITSAAGPSASIIATTNVTCFGGLDGSVLIGATGGTAPITYSIDLAGPTPPTPFQLSNSFTSLVAGTYTVTVKDANGCTGTTTFTITAPPALTYTTVKTNVTCNGACDGTITVNPSGGVPGYTYSSNNGLTFGAANPMTGLCAGTIFVVVKDVNGCLANSTVLITQPAAITAGYTLVNPICPGACNGSVTVTGTAGGTAPYTFSANGGPFTGITTLTGLCAGANTITVKDANGCTLTSTQTLVDPPHYTINVIDTTESHCGFNDGSLEVAAAGGFPAYSYINLTTGVGPQPTGLFPSLVGGGYLIQATDAHGCIEQLFVGVNDVEMDGVLDGLTNATCYNSCDGTVQTHAILGAPPIQYELDLNGTFLISGNFTSLCAGSHIVTMVDNGFCVFTIPFTITQPDTILYSSIVANVACNAGATGSITITGVTGGSGGYSYSDDGGTTFQASPTFNGLTAGTYNLMVQDVNGCLGSGTATVTQAPALSYTTNITDLTCFNNNTGFLQIVATGGTGALTYSIDGGTTFSAGFTFVSLAAGTYNIVVKDAAGCQITGTATINQPTPVAAAYVMTPTTCNGSCDGTLTVNAAGGTPPYLYSSDGGTTYQISNVLTSLCSGSYSVFTKDDNNCLVGSFQNVTQPTAVTFGVTVTPATCGNNNGTITITGAAGGTPGYSYSDDGGTTFQAGNSFAALAPGNYNLVVKDANGCTFPGTATIVNQASPFITSAFVTNVTCNGACNGTLAAAALGGTGAINFDIGGAPQLSGNFSGLCPGAFTLTITDANGCQDSQPFTVTQPAVLTLTPAGTNLLCNNDHSGTVTITPAGGTIPYTFSFDGGTTFSGLNTQTVLAAGTYNLEIKDANGCTVTGTQTLTEPTALAITSQPQTNPLCFGSCDGDVTVNVTGGTVAGLYTYAWAGGIAGPAQNTAINLCSGTYSVDVSDDNGCTISATWTLVDPAPFLISSVAETDVLCFGDCNGTLSITAPGGIQFSDNNGATFQAGNTFAALCPGVYTVIVQNINGCQATSVGIVGEPTVLQVISTPDSIYCSGAGLPLFGFAFGGVGPYSYSWDNGVNTQAQTVFPVGVQTYVVTATDANGCVSPTTSTTYTPLNPYVATIAATDTITCPGDPVTITVSMSSGNPAYLYNWGNGDVDSTLSFTNNGSQTYTCIVTDQCFDYDTLTININTYTLPAVAFSVNDTSGCPPFVVTFYNNTPAAQVGGNCVWTLSDGSTLLGCDSVTTTINAPGCYNVGLLVTSPDGCDNTLTTNSAFCVNPNPTAQFVWTPEKPSYYHGDVQFYDESVLADTWSWDFAGLGTSIGQNPNFDFTGIDTGDFNVCLTVTTLQGCADSICHLVHVYEDFAVYIPNVFTPDGDGVNDLFFPVLGGVVPKDLQFMIFDRWGELIYMGTTLDSRWDGTYKSIKCKEDVYVWKARVTDYLDVVHDFRGHVTLLR